MSRVVSRRAEARCWSLDEIFSAYRRHMNGPCHSGDAATSGKSPWSDAYSFLSVTRGDPGAPRSHSRTAALFVIRAPVGLDCRRARSKREHAGDHGVSGLVIGRRLAMRVPEPALGHITLMTTPTWPHGHEILTIISVSPKANELPTRSSTGETASSVTRSRLIFSMLAGLPQGRTGVYAYPITDGVRRR